MYLRRLLSTVFFFNDTATTEIYTLSLHDALPIYFKQKAIAEFSPRLLFSGPLVRGKLWFMYSGAMRYLHNFIERSEEHTSELQSRPHLVCRLLLEKTKKPRQ